MILSPRNIHCLLILVLSGSIVFGGSSTSTSKDAPFATEVLGARGLEYWVVTGCEVELNEGVLRLVAGDGFVRLPHRLRDFELSFSFKPEKDREWDSGLYFRCELPAGETPWPKRYQINLRQGQEGRLLGVKGGDVSQDLISPGDWNHFHLRVIGSSATLTVNGREAWQVENLEPASGFVGIQSEVPLGGSFRFKDMKLVELDSRSIFNGKDLSGWSDRGGENRSWETREGLLVCNGKKGSWLRLDEQQGDFNLRLEYHLKDAGNSGVYIRVPEDGNHHGKGSGIEVQILDDRHPKYDKLKDYQAAASLYAIVPANPRVSRGAGVWNQLEIDASGHRYEVWHNGQRVIQADGDTHPALLERRIEGYLGLQNHSEEVQFRDLRLSKTYLPAQETSQESK